MKKFTIYNHKGEILRVGICSDEDFELQAQEGEKAVEGLADMEMNNPIPSAVPPQKIKPARITNEQWQNVLDRLSKLETKA